MCGLAVLGKTWQALAAAIVFTLLSALGTDPGLASGMMGSNGGMKFNNMPMMVAPQMQMPHCRPPEVFVQGQGCVAPGKPGGKPATNLTTCPTGYAPKLGGGCVKEAASCPPGMLPLRGGCVKEAKSCPAGTVPGRDGGCVKETTGCTPPDVYSAEAHGCVPPKLTTNCRYPEIYSREQQRCTIPTRETGCTFPDIYSPQLGHCIRPPPSAHPVSCSYPMVAQGSSCICGYGTVWGGDGCVTPPPVIVTPPPVIVTNPPPPPAVVITNPPPPGPGIDVVHIQQCLQKLGYYTGTVDGQVGDATRTAFRAYQQASGLSGQPLFLGDSQSQSLLFQKCNAPVTPTPVSLPNQPPAPPASPAPARCLAPDLYDMLKTTYGKDPTLPACTPQTAACLPKPLSFDGARLQSVAASSGVTWCDDRCIRLGSYLPLSTIDTIESAAHVTLCAAPAALCYAPGRPVVEKQLEVRTIYKDLPVGAGNEGNIAVVIGNETYGNGITPHVYGHADADAVVQLLTEQLGYHKDNIIDLRDAKLADLDRVFGSADNPAGDLAARIKAQHGQTPPNVIVYISGHGLAKEDGGTAYLLPVDGKTDDLDHTGYPLQQLYANLGKAGASTIMLMLEASFGTTITDAIDAPNIPQLDVAAMPETPVAGLAVFTASDRDQHALEDPEYGIGLFTRYMIAGLAGDADNPPIGKGDKRIDTVELYVYASDKVRNAARKSFGVEQKPILSKIDNLVVGTLASN
jgi:hypothetical protein